ncbi:hypothetical protein ERJ75_000422300 [Trypanosoma vivax]|nr:hypothetical protein ERJ75_000422300 [Trypanosoma vivax]
MSTAPGRLVFKAGEGSAHRPRNKKTGGTRKTNSETEDKLETPAANNSSGEISFITHGPREARGATGSETARRRHALGDEKGKAACSERSQRNAEKRGGRTPPRSNGTQQTATQRPSVFGQMGRTPPKMGRGPGAEGRAGTPEARGRAPESAGAPRRATKWDHRLPGHMRWRTVLRNTKQAPAFIEHRTWPPIAARASKLGQHKTGGLRQQMSLSGASESPGTDNKRGFVCSCALCGAQRGF